MLPLGTAAYQPQGTWGASHTWSDGRDTYSVSGFESRQGALEVLWRGLNSTGYTLPKWWEFWRWSEQLPPSH